MSFQAATRPVVVVTGASSGIGRATAHAFAERGARLVLAARRQETLQVVAGECGELGAEALVVPTDVTDSTAVHALAQQAIERFGHIDAWINNAGVGVVGRYDEVPLTLHRRVVETNLLGHMHGTHAALAHFRARGRGTLVNMASLGGWLPTPLSAAYAASKFAVRGFTESVRAEVHDFPDIHVCAVYPTFVDTPGVGHGANRVGKRLQPPSPLLDPRDVARAIADLLDRPRPTVMLGLGSAPARLTHALAPDWVGKLEMRAMSAALARADHVGESNGNLFEPSVVTDVEGGYRRARMKKTASVAIAVSALALGALALGVGRRA